MNRRGLLKTAGLCLAAACLPKFEWGGEMRYGDLLAKLASGQTLSPGEIEQLRLWGNNEENILSRVNTLAGPSAGLDANVFQNSNAFSVLPGEFATAYMGAGSSFTVQSGSSEGTSGWTYVQFSPTSVNGATRSFGIPFSTGAGDLVTGFNVNGVPRQQLFHIQAWAYFLGSTVGDRDIRIMIDDGSNVTANQRAASSGATTVHIAHRRTLITAQTKIQLQVHQNSGGPITLQPGHAYMTIARER